MNIIFEGPHYYCKEDENQFFEWIYSLPEYADIVGHGRELTLTLKEPVSYESTVQLLTMFDRWEIEKGALCLLKTEETKEHLLWQKKNDN